MNRPGHLGVRMYTRVSSSMIAAIRTRTAITTEKASSFKYTVKTMEMTQVCITRALQPVMITHRVQCTCAYLLLHMHCTP